MTTNCLCVGVSLKHVKLFLLLLFITFTFAICHRPAVCLSSVTLVHPTQAIEIFGNVSCYLVPWPPFDIQVKFYGVVPGEPLRGCKIGAKLLLITNRKSHITFDWYQTR